MKVPALRPGRRIEGISAVLLPFTAEDTPDWGGFRGLLDRTWSAGLTPAVNMDTGYVHLLTLEERERVLATTGDMAAGRRFVAGAFIEDLDGDPVALYLRAIEQIRRQGGTPIIFQCGALARSRDEDVVSIYRAIAAAGAPLLAFELGTMFAPFGRIYSSDVVARLMDLDAFVGVKHRRCRGSDGANAGGISARCGQQLQRGIRHAGRDGARRRHSDRVSA